MLHLSFINLLSFNNYFIGEHETRHNAQAKLTYWIKPKVLILKFVRCII